MTKALCRTLLFTKTYKYAYVFFENELKWRFLYKMLLGQNIINLR